MDVVTTAVSYSIIHQVPGLRSLCVIFRWKNLPAAANT